MTKPFIDNPEIIGTFTKEFALDCKPYVSNSFLRFLSYDDTQRDPVYAFFSPSIKSTIIKRQRDYCLCRFTPGKIPAVGRILYNKKKLLNTSIGKNKSFIDMESTEIVSRAGHQLFAYVPKAKIRHWHADNLWHLIKKRPLRNLGNSSLGDQSGDYLPNIEKRHYLWFNYKSRKDVLRIIGWIIYAHLILPELIRGVVKTIRHRDLALLWHPITTLAITDAVIYGFLRHPKGRRVTFGVIKTLLGIKYQSL